MKTSKIKLIEECKEWKGEKGSVFYHNLEMENGDMINLGKKQPLKIGDELNYEIIGDLGQHKYTKAKTVNPNFTQKSGGYDVKGVQAGHSVTAAIYLLQAGIDILDNNIQPETEAQKLYYTALKVAEITETVKNKL